MSVLGLLVLLIVLGVAAFFVNAKMPIGATFKMIINIVLIAVAVMLCLVAFGVWDEVRGMKVPKI